MSNTTVRTMKDDIEESRRKTTSTSNEPAKKKESEKTDPTVSIPKNNLKETNDSADTVKFSDSVNSAQTNELKDLINKISEQTDKDIDTAYDHSPKDQLKETNSPSDLQQKVEQQNEEAEIPQSNPEELKQNDSVKNSTINTNTENNRKKEELLKDVVTEEKSRNAINNEDIENLKNLINKISNIPPKKDDQTANIEKIPSDNINEKSKEVDNKIREDLKPNIATIETKSIIEDRLKQIKTKTVKDIKPIEKNKPEILINSEKPVEKKKEKTSFWNKISKNIKKTSSSKKISALTSNKINNTDENIDKSQIKKEIASSGVLKSSQEIKEKNDSENKKKLISNYYEANYVSPADRLSQGKQELYSSLSKKIKLKGEKGELDALKKTEEGKIKQKEITKDEEYKKLKKSIKQKYHIKLSLLPWKKIIVSSLIVLIIIGIGFWKLFSIIAPPELPPDTPEIIIGEEINEFTNVKNKLTFIANKFNVTQLESDAIKIFNQDKTIDIIKLEIINNDNTKNIVTFEKALAIIGIKNNKTTLPSDFLGLTTNSYNIFIFKTTKDPISIRYGIAVKTGKGDELKTTMKLWEENRIENQKMIKILKPLFIDDSGFEETYATFASINYSEENIELRYAGFIGSETALDYFIHKNILVITTSKDSIFIMADLLVN